MFSCFSLDEMLNSRTSCLIFWGRSSTSSLRQGQCSCERQRQRNGALAAVCHVGRRASRRP